MPTTEEEFTALRERMVVEQLLDRNIHNTAILEAFRTVPREQFILPEHTDYAYRDSPLPIPENQTISQPYVVALMIKLLQLQPTDRVLEVGTGSGYAAAILSRIATAVYTVERHPALVQYARERLHNLQYNNVWVHEGDGTLGWPEHAPYQAIIVAAGGPEVPLTLKQQLAIGGRLIMPVGTQQRKQTLRLVIRLATDKFKTQKRETVAFVPLIGEQGWKNEE